MTIVTSCYLNTRLGQALGCNFKGALDSALTLGDGAWSFTLSLHDFDLASLIETDPKFSLQADDVCIFLLHADNETRLAPFLQHTPYLEQFVTAMQSLPAAAANLLQSPEESAAYTVAFGGASAALSVQPLIDPSYATAELSNTPYMSDPVVKTTWGRFSGRP